MPWTRSVGLLNGSLSPQCLTGRLARLPSMSKGRGVLLRAQHFRSDGEAEADPAVLPRNVQLADEGLHERGLFLGHLLQGLGIGKGHGADHAESVEERRNFEGAFHRVAFAVECGSDVVPYGLSREGQAANAARQFLELRRLGEIRVETLRQVVRAGDCENGGARYAVQTRLHHRVAGRRAQGFGQQAARVVPAGNCDSCG